MSDAKVCGICGDAGDPTPIVRCIGCLTPFHLNLRKDRPGKDCGDAILGESMGVEMLCNNCIEPLRAGADPGGNLLSMFAAMSEGRLVPPDPTPSRPLPPPADPPRPPRPAPPASASEDRPRRRFRRIDR